MNDLISRQMAIEAIDELFKEVVRPSNMSAYEYDSAYAQGEIDAYVMAIDTLKTLAPVQPDHNADVSKKVTDEDCISRRVAIELCDWYDNPSPHDDLEKLPSAQPERSSEIQDILEYLDKVLHPVISPDHWNVYSELHDMISMLPSAQPDHNADISKKVSISCGQENDLISRKAAIDALWKALYEYEDETEKQFLESEELDVGEWIGHRIFVQNMNDIDRQTILNLPSAQPETNCSEIPNSSTDCISRRAAIDALDMAIERYDEMAEEYRKKADIERNDYMDMRDNAYEAQQLAQWLNELKYLREKMANTLWHYPNECYRNLNEYEFAKDLVELGLKSVPSAQLEPKWIPCGERLPSETVIATVETKTFKHRYVCEAVWIPRWTRKVLFDEWEDCSEYKEDDDEYYALEGWYERIHNWDEYAYVAIDDNVIAWMPMPIPYCGGNEE